MHCCNSQKVKCFKNNSLKVWNRNHKSYFTSAKRDLWKRHWTLHNHVNKNRKKQPNFQFTNSAIRKIVGSKIQTVCYNILQLATMVVSQKSVSQDCSLVESCLEYEKVKFYGEKKLTNLFHQSLDLISNINQDLLETLLVSQNSALEF